MERVVNDGHALNDDVRGALAAAIRTRFSMCHRSPLCDLSAPVWFAQRQDVEVEIEIEGAGHLIFSPINESTAFARIFLSFGAVGSATTRRARVRT
jgi:hypothetical protein